jgi:YfiH family protein
VSLNTATLRDTDLLFPDWPAPGSVKAFVTTRSGGVSQGPWASLNLGRHVGDDPAAVVENRRRLRERLPAAPIWPSLVHGNRVVSAEAWLGSGTSPEADGVVSRRAGLPCLVTAADCLPVFFCDRRGSVVGAAHAGWRGLARGILEKTVEAMNVPPDEILCWLGPAIGPDAFEVGPEVREAFIAIDEDAAIAFVAGGDIAPGKFRADIFQLARQRLRRAGVTAISGGQHCTVSDQTRFFSYRRDGVTGRMAAVIWLEAPGTP